MTLGNQLVACAEPLLARYDVAMCDLDGVVYIGGQALPEVADRLLAARAQGVRVAFVTNNASRTPAQVAQHLRDLGIAADATDIVTSAQAAARLVAHRVAPGARVLVVGGEGLRCALLEHGLEPVWSAEHHPAAVVQGFAADVGWRQLREGAVAVSRGLPWIATNTDETVPTPRGPAPGNGLLVEVIARTTGARPEVAGKPEPALFEETLLRVGGRRPLVVGDRLDTDIAGAVRCGVESLLVLTGVTDVLALAAAKPGQRPSYISGDLAGLFHPHAAPRRSGPRWCCGGWTVRLDEAEGLRLDGHGDPEDGLRALVSLCWEHDLHPQQIEAAWRGVGSTALLP